MQNCNILVALNGDKNNVVYKENVSVAESVVLMAIHGKDSVSRVPKTTTENNVVTAEVIDRLNGIYGAEQVAGVYGNSVYSITLPTRLNDIGLGGDEDIEPVKVSRRNPKAAADPVDEAVPADTIATEATSPT